MKCTIPEISWHNRDPVLSVDIQPIQSDCYKLATAGTDCHILLWNLKICKNGSVDLRVVSDLSRHQKSVNVVRWSSSGTYLASGDDDANIIIWTLRNDQVPLFEEETNNEECWIVFKILRGHKEDVYDISWSPNDTKLVSGSIDNTAILWDLQKGQSEIILSDHKGFVQGVHWDPKGEIIATISSDRICRIFDNTGKHVRARIHKGYLPVEESHALYEKEIKYFHDDTFKSYFRRLTFSPDGNLLIVPSGSIDVENYNEVRNATYIFSIGDLGSPIAFIPSARQVTIAVRCCPILFELHADGPNPIIDLPYRMVIAIATDSDVVLYDTQQVTPFAHFRKVHYTRITDLAWSSDGLLLIASSTDGFCTLITFEPSEIGIQHIIEDSEPEDSSLNISGCEELVTVDDANKNEEEVEIKKPNILEQWAVRTPKQDVTEILSKNIPEKSTPNSKEKTNKLVPKRIAPLRVGDITKVEKKKACVDTPIIIIDDDCSNDKSSYNHEKNNASQGQSRNKDETTRNSINKNSILNFFQITPSKNPETEDEEPISKSRKAADSLVNTICSNENIIYVSDESQDADKSKFTEKENLTSKLDSPDRTKLLDSKNNIQTKVNTAKTPRRIPFVTLASPKRKKKE